MHFLTSLCVVAASLSLQAAARPRGVSPEAIIAAYAKRTPQADANDDGDIPPTLIGDLKTVGATTPVGQSISNILLGTESAEAPYKLYLPPGLLGSKACKADQCCVWSYVAVAMSLSFQGITLRCNDLARAAIRLGFHDAGTWSSTLAASGKDFGGADSSIALSGTEVNRAENNGLQAIIKQMISWQKTFGVPMADLIQFGAVHAVVTCPLGPRIRFFAGRKDSKVAAPDGLLPSATASADSLITLFEDKTISAHDLAALLGAHSTSKQFFFNKTAAAAPQDGTPGVWDVLFYNQTLENTPNKVFRLPSDIALAQHPSMADEWTKFRQPNNVGQKHWNEDYAKAYTRLSLLGVNNINNMTECSKVLPPAKPTFLGSSTLFVDS